jgi:hypothetical protein
VWSGARVEQALPLPTRRIDPGATVEERPFRAALRVTEEKAFRPRCPLARASTPRGPFKPGFGLSGRAHPLQRRTMPPMNFAPRVHNPRRRHPERSRHSYSQRGESILGATVEERPFRAALRVTEEKAFRPRGPLACTSRGGPFKPGFGLSGSAHPLQARTMPSINLATRVHHHRRRHPERSRPSGEARACPERSRRGSPAHRHRKGKAYLVVDSGSCELARDFGKGTSSTRAAKASQNPTALQRPRPAHPQLL